MEEVIFEALKKFSRTSMTKLPERELAEPQNWNLDIKFEGVGM
jgi:hypothetical protein